MLTASKGKWIKVAIRVVILSALGAAVGILLALQAQVWLEQLDDRLYSGGDPLWSGNPPTAESFVPLRAVPRQPLVTDFRICSRVEADKRLDDDELVLALTVDGKSRAYPINMMTGPQREVFNDKLADREIAATW